MIFVSVGTNEAPFDRLVAAVEAIEGEELVVCQHGASRLRPSRAACVDFLAFEEVVEHVRGARAVVTHAGIGSVLVALANGKRPLVVPRLRRYGEAVDDHQVLLARRLAGEGLVRLVDEPPRLAAELAAGGEELPPLGPGTRLACELGDYLGALAGGRRAGEGDGC